MNLLSLIIPLFFVVEVYSWDFGSYNTYLEKAKDLALCTFGECCRKHDIPADFNGLEEALRNQVYGQHLVQSITDALRAHWEYEHPKKPLTISFHGWPGGGKNYVASFIAKYLFRKGAQSKFVHWFIGRLHFPEESHVTQYKTDLYSWIKGNTSICPQQLFVFDEVDKMPAGLLNALKNVIDYRDNVEGVDYRKAIFIFLSNTGQNLINSKYLEYWKQGVSRESLKLSDFENLILQGAFNEGGGFQYSDTIKSNLIDHYIPFLPLEMKHIKLCILDEFRSRGVQKPSDEHVQEILDDITWEIPQEDEVTGVLKIFTFFREILEIIDWGPAPETAFSKTGCKRVSQKVSMLVTKHYRHLFKPEL